MERVFYIRRSFITQFMSTEMKSNFQNLPVELIHRIFDYIDAETIIFSIRYACKRLYSIVNTYDRYELDFRFISGSDIPLMKRIIGPKNIISIILSNEKRTRNTCRVFFDHFHIEKLVRLRSLDLTHVSGKDLDKLQKHIMQYPLRKFCISGYLFCDRKTRKFLSSIVSHTQLRKIEFNMNIGCGRIILNWPISYGLVHITVGKCSWITLYHILDHFPNLQTLATTISVVNSFRNELNIEHVDNRKFDHLVSLSLVIKDFINMENIESLLLCLPSLTHLRLIFNEQLCDTSLLDGSRWENFIETKLPLLNRFEFSFLSNSFNQSHSTTVESLITPFQTLFWLETKQWIIKCDDGYSEQHGWIFHIYSIPIVIDSFRYPDRPCSVLHSKLNIAGRNEIITVNAHRLYLYVSEMMSRRTQEQVSVTFPFYVYLDSRFD